MINDSGYANAFAASSYSGWDMAATGGSSAVWRVYEGQSIAEFLSDTRDRDYNVTQ